MKSQLRSALASFLALTLITGIIYPGIVTLIAHLCFPRQAQGSLILAQGHPIGSTLIGQPFTDPKYFWSRPSATTPIPYNGNSSSGSNLGPSNPAMTDSIRQRCAALHAADPDNTALAPVDLVTASASGLDPEISLAAALYQAPRVARARILPLSQVQQLVAEATCPRTFGVLGEARVNVLQLNLSLDRLPPAAR